MRVCTITPHLPPEQAANALLPVMLGDALKPHGVSTHYIAHAPAVGASSRLSDVTYVPRRGRGPFGRSRPGAVAAAIRMALGMKTAIARSDLVHLHGNGFIVEVGAVLAQRFGTPYVITLYGTDVWHHEPARHARFADAVRRAAHRIFYSQALLEFARPLGLASEPASVIYAPVSADFRPLDEPARREARRALGAGDGPILLTVKRLHPVGGHETLLRALPAMLRRHPAIELWLIGEGELRAKLEAEARTLGVDAHVRFLGLLDHQAVARYCAAADLFVLPSSLESWGTVMLEALASGTPVVTTDTAGGVEVRDRFPEDVTVVEKGNAEALADAVCAALERQRRVTARAGERLQAEFSVERTAGRYLEVYNQSLGGAR